MVHRDRFLALLPRASSPSYGKIKDRVFVNLRKRLTEYYGTKEKRERFAFSCRRTPLYVHTALHCTNGCSLGLRALSLNKPRSWKSRTCRNTASFLGLTVLRVDLTSCRSAVTVGQSLVLTETLRANGGGSDVVLAPLFDGALSPRMFGILIKRI